MRAPRRSGPGAGVGLLEAGEDAQQRGLAGPVGADQPDALAGAQVEGQVGEQRPWAEALGHALGRSTTRSCMFPSHAATHAITWLCQAGNGDRLP